ncbi:MULTISPECIES: hypothetical protein [Stenotrophomonas maltophilia group]|uniref:hypothetical protein n=1 Tax=Stenotrophomonas maltophilia group TaxID=995085 RepID=UPI0011B65509|nr:hypothetical protein [Stenotrophomonas maltophilia]
MTATKPITTTCYRCDAEPTTKDHVPPKCIFPDNMRNNLITVPSCEVHNNSESSVDEYIRNLATMGFEASQVGLDQFKAKALRGIQRGNSKFQATKAVMVDPATGIQQDAFALGVDYEKVMAALTKIAWGLHYHCTGRRCDIDPVVVSLLTRNEDEEVRKNTHDFYTLSVECLSTFPWEGENSEVFKYKFASFENGHLALAHFYDAPAFIAHYRASA